MSVSDKRAAIGAALATVSCLALAGMGQTTGAPATNDPVVAATPEQGKIQLRCWQQGRLLFDARSLEDMPNVSGARLALKGKTADGPLQVIDLDDAVCLVLPLRAAAGG